MENSNLPAMPLSNEMSSDLDSAIGSPDRYGFPTAMGLTKREHIAIAAMQGLISGGDCVPPNDKTIHHMVSMASVMYADALLLELAK